MLFYTDVQIIFPVRASISSRIFLNPASMRPDRCWSIFFKLMQIGPLFFHIVMLFRTLSRVVNKPIHVLRKWILGWVAPCMHWFLHFLVTAKLVASWNVTLGNQRGDQSVKVRSTWSLLQHLQVELPGSFRSSDRNVWMGIVVQQYNTLWQ